MRQSTSTRTRKFDLVSCPLLAPTRARAVWVPSKPFRETGFIRLSRGAMLVQK